MYILYKKDQFLLPANVFNGYIYSCECLNGSCISCPWRLFCLILACFSFISGYSSWCLTEWCSLYTWSNDPHGGTGKSWSSFHLVIVHQKKISGFCLQRLGKGQSPCQVLCFLMPVCITQLGTHLFLEYRQDLFMS